VIRSGSIAPSPAEAERIARANAAAAGGGEGIAALVQQLGDPSWVVRRIVIRLLADLGEPAVPALLTGLVEARDDENRVAALVDVLAATSAAVDDRITKLCAHSNPAIVADAADLLGRRRARAGVTILRELVEADNDVVAVAAIEALGRIGGRAAVESLVAAVRSGRFFRTFPAIDVLGRTGDPRALGPLAELLDDVRYTHEAARALGRTGDPGAVGPLLELVKRPVDAQVRVAAVALVELHETYATLYGSADAIDLLVRDRAAPTTARRLIAAMRSSAPAEQAALLRILGAVGSEEASPVLTERLDGPEIVAQAAAEALRRLGSSGMATLSNALRDGDSARRRLVLEVLQPRSVAMDDVLAALGDPDGVVRAKACELLGRIGRTAAVPALFDLLCDPNPRVSHAALGAIQALGGELTESLAVSAASSSDVRLARQAFRIIGYFGFVSGIDTLVKGIASSDSALRELAVHSLGYIDDPKALAAVLEAAAHAEPRMRAAAMRSLGHGDAMTSAPRLLEALDDSDAWVRYYACQSLGRLRHEDAAPAIARRLSDPAGQVRIAAIDAMSQLHSPAALGFLMSGARSADDDVRRACLTGMAITRRLETLPLVLEATAASDAATRLVATSALAAFDAPEVSPRLAALATDDPDEAVRYAALSALGERPGNAATTALIGLLSDRTLHARVRELLANGVAGRADGILEVLRDTDEEVAAVLTSALARMRRAEGYSGLVAALALPCVASRKAAAITAAAVGSRALLDALRGRADTDPDPEVRRLIASALRS
jgi:HEAT repeat protein